MNGSLTVPGSRFFRIGGTFYRTHVRRRASIRLEAKQSEQKESLDLRVPSARPLQCSAF